MESENEIHSKFLLSHNIVTDKQARRVDNPPCLFIKFSYSDALYFPSSLSSSILK